MESACLLLPPPISTNDLFINRKMGEGRGRIKSPEYKAWKTHAAQVLLAQHRPSFTIPVFVSLMVGEVGVGSMDSDNCLKAALDMLKEARIIVDDNRKWVRSSRATWVPGFRGIVAIVAPAVAPPAVKELRRNIPSSVWEVMQGHATKLPR